jgi:hypothetical protein
MRRMHIKTTTEIDGVDRFDLHGEAVRRANGSAGRRHGYVGGPVFGRAA